MSFFFWPFRLLLAIPQMIFGLLLTLSCLLTLASLFAPSGWLWSMLTHFRLQYLSIQLIALLWMTLDFFVFSRQKASRSVSCWGLMLLMFCAGLNLMVIAPYYQRSLNGKSSARGSSVRLLHMNLFGPYNRDMPAVASLLRSTRPDLLDFVEYTTPWRQRLEQSGLLKRYPYRFSVPGHIALYSRFPIQAAKTLFPKGERNIANQAYILAKLRLPVSVLTVVVAHPASPMTPKRWQWQRALFDTWIHDRPHWGHNVLIVGDLNTSPWSPEFLALLRGTRLRDSQAGFGLQPSWPALIPGVKAGEPLPVWMFPLGLPIDHVLLSPDMNVLTRQTGGFVGSDHLPVVLDFSFSKAASVSSQKTK